MLLLRIPWISIHRIVGLLHYPYDYRNHHRRSRHRYKISDHLVRLLCLLNMEVSLRMSVMHPKVHLAASLPPLLRHMHLLRLQVRGLWKVLEVSAVRTPRQAAGRQVFPYQVLRALLCMMDGVVLCNVERNIIIPCSNATHDTALHHQLLWIRVQPERKTQSPPSLIQQ